MLFARYGARDMRPRQTTMYFTIEANGVLVGECWLQRMNLPEVSAMYPPGADVLHCLCDDYNVRSRRVWENNGSTLAYAVSIPQPAKGQMEYRWRLTKVEHAARAASVD